MASAGVDLLFDSSAWAAIGVVENLSHVIPLTRAKNSLVSKWIRQRPDLFIPIDFGYFNVRLASPIHAAGIPVLYYFPPRSWSQQTKASPLLKASVDAVATPFPWSAQVLQQAGVPAAFVGHPLLDTIASAPRRSVLHQEWDLDPAAPIFALLPGSRDHEVRHLWPTLLQAARLILNKEPHAQFLTPVAPTIDIHKIQRDTQRLWARISRKEHERRSAASEQQERYRLNQRVVEIERKPEARTPELWSNRNQDESGIRNPDSLPLRLVEGRTGDVLGACDIAAVCSGTAALEAAVQARPMVVIYRGSTVMALEWRLRKPHLAIPFIGMPNILAGRSIVTELIQEAATPEAIAREALELLHSEPRSQQMMKDLRDVAQILGFPGAIERTAQLALGMARGEPIKDLLPKANIAETVRGGDVLNDPPVQPGAAPPSAAKQRGF